MVTGATVLAYESPALDDDGWARRDGQIHRHLDAKRAVTAAALAGSVAGAAAGAVLQTAYDTYLEIAEVVFDSTREDV